MLDPVFLKRTASTIAMASSLPGATIVGGLIGYQVDQWLGSAPIGALGLGALAFAATVTQLLRSPPTRPPDDDDPAPHPPP